MSNVKEYNKKGYKKGHPNYYLGKYPKQFNYKSKLYKIYASIIQRCSNPKDKGYKNYGGRGIKICEEWENDYMAFCNWCIENGYSEQKTEKGRNKLTIDRINNDGNYEPSNCRWIVQKQNERNKRTNKFITYNGETHCLIEWAEILNLPSTTLYNRLFEGWSVERAFNTPINEKHKNKKYLKIVRNDL